MKIKSTKKVKSNSRPLNPIKLGVLGFILTFAVIGAAYVFASSAASGLPTGTIAINTNSDLRYGGMIRYDTSVSGRLSPKGYTYVSMVCRQVGAPQIFYQVSQSYSNDFQLTNLKIQGLPEWNGQPGECLADFIYRVDGQKPTIHTMASTGWFSVAGAQ